MKKVRLPHTSVSSSCKAGTEVGDVSELIASHSFCILQGTEGRPQKLTQLALLHPITRFADGTLLTI